MNLCLSNVLDNAALTRLRSLLAAAAFSDGASTAGWNARAVKHNLQASHDGAAQLVREALLRHPLFDAALFPARLRTPLFSRYTTGMSYGTHMDNALMRGPEPLRTDLAVTLFLSEPADYDGGELIIDTPGGALSYKLAAGQAVVYPATHLHQVAPVTRGERLAAVLWVQSHVRDAAQRELLFDLDSVRRHLWGQAGNRATPDFDLLSKTYSNLLRSWADS